ncbi:MAG: hypothetical protein DRR06_13950 [Gammaproteobacteria bacterium]|nr:MAG: hypothetical protein DRR06_13950 [Gammaproteobacteria bacterium]
MSVLITLVRAWSTIHNETILVSFEIRPMPAFTIKNIPDDLYSRLKEAAQAHRRTILSGLLMQRAQQDYA